MTTVEIFLDSKTNVFFPNSEITGKIYLNTTEAEIIRKVNVTIVGRAYVFFLIKHYHGSRPYESEHYYLNENKCLWELNETNQLLNGEEYWFPFKFIIPSNAPANVNEKCGRVEYYVKGEIEFNGKPSEIQYYGFSVCSVIDLNNLDLKLKLTSTAITRKYPRKFFSCTKNILNVKVKYWFPFKFIIPSNAPANVNEEFGVLHYFIKANIEFYGKKFWGYKKYNEFQYYGFSVCPIIDLNNLDSKLKLSASTEITQNVRKCFSCTKNPLNVKMTLPKKTGYVCGETFSVKIEIYNKTSMKIESIEYGIELKCLYAGSYEYLWPHFVETLNKETTFYVAKDCIKPETDSTICEILIPPLSPTFTDCSILKLEYSVFVKIHTNAFFQSSPIVSIPITIGTVPLKKSESEETLNAMEILKSVNFLEGSNRCKMDGKYKEIEGPKSVQPKFACYSNLS
uniref:Arrestin C-terminal-like domain-containing protein n=1 Tax=Panagrolaimus sp. PS1159 TaxID=55785 RepID=A0AC35G158_9BILA